MACLTTNVLRTPRVKNKVIILMIVVFSFFAIWNIRPSDKKAKVPSWLGTLQCTSIAISELKYGLKGNIGYRKIYNVFYPALEGGDAGVSIIEMNRAINSALHIEDVSSSDIHYNLAGGTGRGLTEFMKLSFRIFGYKAESFFYLYIVLITISIFFFLVSFKNNPASLFIGLLFVISYYIITTTTVVKFETIIGIRFFPLLTILPIIHISLITMDKHKLSISTFVGVFVQTSILIFSFYIRASSRYQFMFLCSLPFFLFIYNKTHQKFASHCISIKQFYPLYIVLVCMLFYVSILSGNSVAEKNNKYPIWHQLYMGLAGHPQAVEKYGITFSDIVVMNMVAKKEAEAGRYIDVNNSLQNLYHGIHPDKTNFPIPGEQYEKIVKSEFFRILQNDPYFVMSSYFYKVPFYLKVFFSNSKNASYLPEGYGNIDGLHKITNLYLMIAVIFAAFLIREDIIRQWMPYFHLLFLNLAFALIPPIITLPAVHTVLDSGLLLIMAIYLLFARLSLGFYVKGRSLLSGAAESSLRLPVGLGGLKRLNLSEFYIPGAVALFSILAVGVIIQLHKLEVSVRGLSEAIRQEKTAIQGETVKQPHGELETSVGKLTEAVRQIEATKQPQEELESRVGKLVEVVRQIEAIKQPPTPQLKFKEVEGFSNGSFESWVETPEGQFLPEGFTYYQDGSGGSVQKNTLEVGLKEGEASVLLRPSSSGNSYIRFGVHSFMELRGHVVRLGMWVKSQNKTPKVIQIDVQDGVTPAAVESYNGRGDWQWLEVETDVHERAKYLYITCNIKHDATDVVYLDGMKLEFYEEK